MATEYLATRGTESKMIGAEDTMEALSQGFTISPPGTPPPVTGSGPPAPADGSAPEAVQPAAPIIEPEPWEHLAAELAPEIEARLAAAEVPADAEQYRESGRIDRNSIRTFRAACCGAPYTLPNNERASFFRSCGNCGGARW